MSRDSDAPPAPVAFGRWAVPLLAEQLRLPGRDVRLRALAALIDVLRQPLRGPEALTEGRRPAAEVQEGPGLVGAGPDQARVP